MTNLRIEFSKITGKKDVDNRRLLRLALAAVEDDFAQLEAVAADVYEDERGSDVALWELIVGAATELARIWAAEVGPAETAQAIRLELQRNPAQEAF